MKTAFVATGARTASDRRAISPQERFAFVAGLGGGLVAALMVVGIDVGALSMQSHWGEAYEMVHSAVVDAFSQKARTSVRPGKVAEAPRASYPAPKGCVYGDAEDCRNAAFGGDMVAEFNLGRMYAHGVGVSQDFSRAALHYREAADRGDPAAQTNYAGLLDQGNGVPHDPEAAVAWLRIAAGSGFAPAQYDLAVHLHDGRGVAVDLAEAMRWYRAAANQGLAPAEVNLGAMFAAGEGAPRDLTRAVELYRKASDQGDDVAQYDLARAYETGRGVEPDAIRAATLYRLSAAQGNASALLKIGERHARVGATSVSGG